MGLTGDPASDVVLLVLAGFILIEVFFRVQLLFADAVFWVLEKLAARRTMTARVTAEEKMLSEYMIG
jgi:hypothetical protein